MRRLCPLAPCLCAVLCSCCLAADTFMANRHGPFHPTSAQPVTFRCQATDSDGIATVELWVYEYELISDNGAKSAVRRANGQWGLVKSWTYESHPPSIDESY